MRVCATAHMPASWQAWDCAAGPPGVLPRLPIGAGAARLKGGLKWGQPPISTALYARTCRVSVVVAGGLQQPPRSDRNRAYPRGAALAGATGMLSGLPTMVMIISSTLSMRAATRLASASVTAWIWALRLST